MPTVYLHLDYNQRLSAACQWSHVTAMSVVEPLPATSHINHSNIAHQRLNVAHAFPFGPRACAWATLPHPCLGSHARMPALVPHQVPTTNALQPCLSPASVGHMFGSHARVVLHPSVGPSTRTVLQPLTLEPYIAPMPRHHTPASLLCTQVTALPRACTLAHGARPHVQPFVSHR